MFAKSARAKVPKARKPLARKALSRKPPKAAGRKRPAGLGRKGGKAITHLCGHKQVHAITGPAWKKDRELERLKTRVCTDCWAGERARELEGLLDLASLPELEGTPAQVLWARSIRAEALLAHQTQAAVLDRQRREACLSPASDRYMAIVAPALLQETRAKWWIDEHEAPGFHLALLSFGDQDALQALRLEAVLVPPCPF